MYNLKSFLRVSNRICPQIKSSPWSNKLFFHPRTVTCLPYATETFWPSYAHCEASAGTPHAHTGAQIRTVSISFKQSFLFFHAFLRIGEITIRGKDRHTAHLIQKNQIRMQTGDFKLKLISYKQSRSTPLTFSHESTGPGPMPCLCNASLLTSSGRQAWPPIPVCHSHTVLRNQQGTEACSTVLWPGPDNLQEPQFPHWGSYYSSTAGAVCQPN